MLKGSRPVYCPKIVKRRGSLLCVGWAMSPVLVRPQTPSFGARPSLRSSIAFERRVANLLRPAPVDRLAPRLPVKIATPLLLVLLALPACSSGNLSVGQRDADAAIGGSGGEAGVGAQPSQRAAALPIGIANVNNSPLLAANYRALLRFVPERALNVDRIYFGFNLAGASCEPGATGDGSGDGGIVDASLMAIDENTGAPSDVLEHEAVDACARYEEARAEVGSTPVLVWMNVSAALEPGTMYGLLVRNAHADPEANYFSFHMPTRSSPGLKRATSWTRTLQAPSCRSTPASTLPGRRTAESHGNMAPRTANTCRSSTHPTWPTRRRACRNMAFDCAPVSRRRRSRTTRTTRLAPVAVSSTPTLVTPALSVCSAASRHRERTSVR
jgi:hypothetical protein